MASSAGGSETITIARQASEAASEANDVPPLDDLLVALDVASREETAETEQTILALVARAKADGVEPREYLALAILIAFRRRNHAASQAQGMGAGERRLLRTILRAIAAHDPAAVVLILPLIPLYGSWKDLALLAEELLADDESAASGEGELPFIVDAIIDCFAEQLAHDDALPKGELPSSAAKYAPHEGRHAGGGRDAQSARRLAKILADAIARRVFDRAAEGEGSAAGEGEGGAAGEGEGDTAGKRKRDGGSELGKDALRAKYRKLRAGLNKRLAEAGHLLEPLLAAKRLDAIDFKKAPKGALAKCRKALLKDPHAAARWKKAMAASDKAVPDITDIVQAVAESGDDELELLPRRIAKAIAALKAAREQLQAKAASMLEQLEAAAEVGTSGDGAAGRTSDAMASLREGGTLPTLPVVLTAEGRGVPPSQPPALLLAAFVAARSQNLRHVAVDGELIAVTSPEEDAAIAQAEAKAVVAVAAAAEPGTSGASAPAPAPVPTPSFEAFVDRAAEPFRHGGGGGSGAARLLAGGTRMLDAVDGGAGDILVICSGFTPASDPVELAGATASLKAHGMRLLLVHRLREAADAAVGRFKPRANLRPMPPRGSEVVDVCFILDLTGSMGQWIDQCKTHVSNVIRALKADLAVGEVRVSFVGYRDWGERNSPHAPRVVVHEFVPLSRVDEVTAAIGREGADGGGDGPEDVIIAIERALRLEWRGDVRVAVFIADAPSHGYSGQGRGGDDFPAGLCPDQRTPLPTLLGRLANEQGVDLLATKLSSYTDRMYDMFADQYPGGDGFGVLSLTDGAHKFKAAIMGALSEAVLSLIAPSANAAGVQTFDGTTLSSLIATLSASLRESLDAAAAALRAPSAEEAAAGVAEHDEMVGDAASRLAALEAELTAAEAAAADAAGGADDDDVEMTAYEAVAEIREEVEAARETLAAARSRPVAPRAARSDASRLRAALEADELRPVRLALGLSLPTESLAIEAAAALLRAGVCVGDMQAKGYPHPFIDAMRAAGATLVKRI